MLLILCLCGLVGAFIYVTGFHDASNSVATLIATHQLPPRKAILIASVMNCLGGLFGTAVAVTMASDILKPELIEKVGGQSVMIVVLASLIVALIWNLWTWWCGLPSSSTHALIGGLCGAGCAMTRSFDVLLWGDPSTSLFNGILGIVLLPLLLSPLVGVVLAWGIMSLLNHIFYDYHPQKVNQIFRPMQIVSSAYVGFSHGMSMTPKAMGVFVLALVSYQAFVPKSLTLLRVDTWQEIPFWMEAFGALIMALGTAAGGWKIIRTMGRGLVKMSPVNGVVAEITTASLLVGLSACGIPLSSTHVITASIAGVGMAAPYRALKWRMVRLIVSYWTLTLPCCFLLGYVVIWAYRDIS